MDQRELTTGYYRPTESYKSIPEHISVCFKDDMGLVAVVGASDESPKIVAESVEYAKLFAASKEMFNTLESIIEKCDEEMGEWSSVEQTYLPLNMCGLYDIREQARGVIELAKAGN